MSVVQRWIEALKSKAYLKCKFELRSSKNSFCALGVLCDTIDSSKWTPGNLYEGFATCPSKRIETLVMSELSLTDEELDKLFSNVADLNDNHNMSFERLAELLSSKDGIRFLIARNPNE